MKVLITGFDPFGGENINPALEAVKLLPDNISDAEVIKIEIPTVFRKSLEKINEEIEKYNPDIVISIGQAGGRFDITPERVAINLDDARIADNEGKQPIDISIYEDGEPAYFSNLPIKAMVNEIKEGGLDAYFTDHTLGVYPTNSAGIPFSADTFQSVGDPISDLTEDMAAEQKARTTYDNILALSKNEDVNKVIRFLREREIVHYQRFAEGLEYVKSQLNKKNYYAYNPSFTSSKREQTCE